jgi:hypothetical protein
MSQFAPCPACNRHIVTDEIECPFCAAALPDSFRELPARPAPRGRLSRAALMAAGAALIGAAGCGGSLDNGGNNDAAADTGSMSDGNNNEGGAVALYGAPAPEYGAPPLASGEG